MGRLGLDGQCCWTGDTVCLATKKKLDTDCSQHTCICLHLAFVPTYTHPTVQLQVEHLAHWTPQVVAVKKSLPLPHTHTHTQQPTTITTTHIVPTMHTFSTCIIFLTKTCTGFLFLKVTFCILWPHKSHKATTCPAANERKQVAKNCTERTRHKPSRHLSSLFACHLHHLYAVRHWQHDNIKHSTIVASYYN